MRGDIHVLTLSATPIPRTLQMALSGVREMSLIATPPVDRLAVRTFVGPWDGVVLREAIKRGGLELYYQPQVNTHNGRVTSVEALIRWPNGERVVMPNEFIRASCRPMAACRRPSLTMS